MRGTAHGGGRSDDTWCHQTLTKFIRQLVFWNFDSWEECQEFFKTKYSEKASRQCISVNKPTVLPPLKIKPKEKINLHNLTIDSSKDYVKQHLASFRLDSKMFFEDSDIPKVKIWIFFIQLY